MLNIRLICVGKLKERFYSEAVAEYSKRLGAFCRLELIELPEERLSENPSASEIETALKFRKAAYQLCHRRFFWPFTKTEGASGPSFEYVENDFSAPSRPRYAAGADLSRVSDQGRVKVP